MEKKYLYLEFRTVDGSKRSIRIEDPDEYITAEQIQQAMDGIIQKDVFEAEFTSKIGAKIVTQVTEEYEV